MEKSADAFLTIGELAERLGVRTHILRYWEEQFPMLEPLKRAGGRRLYRPADVALAETIHDLLSRQGYTIKGAVGYLRKNKGEAIAAPVQTAPIPNPVAPQINSAPSGPQIAFVRDELRRIRQNLTDALADA
ncbi:MerR family transcriptional regulator [Sphingorhabdus sp.]|jgi:DNA-binding transcriptional MerR regulator|uniref:MerR family transcriptional regulator n=1 Tax=Sphingorhabdus sp. TaxID=1902408 RepID=UPI003BB0E037|nr:MerR family transcriptional regulator [Sphingomonadales bacterium]MBK9432517.1 MerR family transcriptional regulator [Sphingomonadales bacterium]MBL0021945.1 MerR family transcriptional regulator [Sphingomonadales bacterium]